MKEKVTIFRGEKVLFQGNILNLPMKEAFIVAKSIEIFNDDDPCIIHQSFIIKELVTELLDLFKESGSTKLLGSEFESKLSFLNYDDITGITIELMR